MTMEYSAAAERRLERRVLRPLSVVHMLLVGSLLWQHAWFVAGAMFVMVLLVGAIGQGLSYNRAKSFAELAHPNHDAVGEVDPPTAALSHDEAFQLSRALMKASGIVSASAAILAGHYGVRWYFVLGTAVAAFYVVLFVGGAVAIRGAGRAPLSSPSNG